jgi:hypothetical protein
MKFFIPRAKGSEEENKIYEATKTHVQKAMGNISSRKIFSIDYKHKDKLHHAEVGKEEKVGNEIIIIILESDTGYFVCTPSRGVHKGLPILIGKGEVISITDFEE